VGVGLVYRNRGLCLVLLVFPQLKGSDPFPTLKSTRRRHPRRSILRASVEIEHRLAMPAAAWVGGSGESCSS
jgi:hypothetical protein